MFDTLKDERLALLVMVGKLMLENGLFGTKGFCGQILIGLVWPKYIDSKNNQQMES